MSEDLPNWFENDGRHNFEHLIPLFLGEKPIKTLQIGAYSGDASVWLCENLPAGSTLVDVDTWEGSNEPVHHAMDWESVEQIYDKKTQEFKDSGLLVKFKGTSDEFFLQNRETFDFIYIDGDHTSYGVLKDAVNAYERLGVGGVIAFDDYQWSAGLGPLTEPKLAIDAFLAVYNDRVRVLINQYQLWVQKDR